MLDKDSFGKQKKNSGYDQLNSEELHLLTEAMVVRLNLFQRKYPAFLPQAVRAIMDHPNLQNSDRSTMETYCKMFELDWRGDRDFANKDEFLSTHPVYVDSRDKSKLGGALNEKVVRSMLRKACSEYLTDLTTKIMKK
jgi:hypothetical protein